jgi:hypothetical protein
MFGTIVMGAWLFAASTAATATEDPLPPFVALEDDSAVRKIAEENSDLKDPFSAQFRNLSVQTIHLKGPPEEISLIYCGEVNAKNSMGAYSGWAPFYATSIKKHFYISRKANDFYYKLYCKDAPNFDPKN